MTDLNALLIFARVVEAGRFSEAARRLKMPTSTVSRRVAELEAQLGVRLLERSTRALRLTEVGAAVFEEARRGLDLGDAVAGIVADHRAHVGGTLRLSAPPSLADALLAPLLGPFQAEHPDVRVEVFVTERFVDHVAEGADLVLRVGAPRDPALVARPILTYRHRLVAAPAYLGRRPAPDDPAGLLDHRLLAFARRKPSYSWTFRRVDGAGAAEGDGREVLTFRPHLAMNDYAGLAAALSDGAGIGDLPPLVRPDLVRDGRLVEVMPRWRFRTLDLALVHLGDRHLPPAARAFAAHAARHAPALFPDLPA